MNASPYLIEGVLTDGYEVCRLLLWQAMPLSLPVVFLMAGATARVVHELSLVSWLADRRESVRRRRTEERET